MGRKIQSGDYNMRLLNINSFIYSEEWTLPELNRGIGFLFHYRWKFSSYEHFSSALI